MATLSVIIPNYNRADLIGETLANVLGQTRAPDEVIVVDDGSTDASCDVIAGFGSAVRLIRQANAGPGAARNRGLAEARGELIQFMDSDDLWSPDKLELQERALAAGEADFAYSPWLQARLENGVAWHADPVLQQGPLPSSRTPLGWYLRGWVIVFQCCLFSRALLEAVGPYRTDLMPTEDSELLFRILSSGARPLHVPEALVLYRLHGGYQISQGGMQNEKRVRDWARFTAVVGAQLDGPAVGASARDIAVWRATEAKAAADLARIEGAAPHAGMADRVRDSLGWAGERIARRWRGSAWAAHYRPGPPTAHQVRSVEKAGYALRQGMPPG